MRRRTAALLVLLSLAPATAWADDHVVNVSATILARCGVVAGGAPHMQCAGADATVTYRVSSGTASEPEVSAPATVLRGNARALTAGPGDVVTIEF